VARLIALHLLDNGPGRGVAHRQALEMLLQVLLDLTLGLGHETQADRLAEPAGQQADAEGSGIPQGVEHAGAISQLAQAAMRPGQVVRLVACRVLELLAQRGVVRGQGLRVVKRLCADFAHVVDAHQGAGQTPLRGVELAGVALARLRAGTRGTVGAGQGTQGIVGAGQDLIDT
jgi:hypothetical protein